MSELEKSEAQQKSVSPEGTIAIPKMVWLDEVTGKPLSQSERAVAFVRDYAKRNNSWPQIKVVMANAGVGQGTAWRALRQMRSNPSDDLPSARS